MNTNESPNLNRQIKRNSVQHILYNEKLILNNIKATKVFLKNNPDLLVTKADKGNVTVVMDRSEYIHKVEKALADKHYYSVINKSPLPKLQNNIKKLLKSWNDKGVFETDDAFNYIKYNDIDNTNLARAYALIKIHKQNNPIRIIVSAIGSPTYTFDKSLSIIFNNYFPRPPSTIKNSIELKNTIEKIIITEEDELNSFDVVSLFTNIPHNLIIEEISKRWKYLNNKINLSKHEFLEGISILLDSTYFQFNNKYYKQTLGAPKGFCTSPWFADIVLETLESSCLKLHKNEIKFFCRYVDDCLLITKKNRTNKILSSFNNYNNKLQFTMEKEKNASIKFLDITLIRDGNKIKYNCYRKETASGRYINFISHPTSQKIAIIYNLTDKAIKLSDPSYHKQISN